MVTDIKPDEVRRINVAVTDDAVVAIELLMSREGVTLTEAVRRLIGYGDFVYRAVRQGDELIVHTPRRFLPDRWQTVELL